MIEQVCLRTWSSLGFRQQKRSDVGQLPRVRLHATSSSGRRSERTNQGSISHHIQLPPFELQSHKRDLIPLAFRNKLSSSAQAQAYQHSTATPASLSINAMHFLLLGATGRTGKHVVSELLSQGHTAVALVRTPGSLPARPGLTLVTGSPLSKDDIRSCLTAAPGLSPSAAIITLNTVRKSDSPFAAQLSPPRFLADSCANVCEVLEQAGIHRIVVMSTAGVGDSWGNLPWLSKAFMGWTNIKYALEDHGLVDKEIRTTKMDWTLVRAVRLDFNDSKTPDDKKTEVETLGSSGVGMGVSDSVTLTSVARFLVKVTVGELFVKEAVVVRN